MMNKLKEWFQRIHKSLSWKRLKGALLLLMVFVIAIPQISLGISNILEIEQNAENWFSFMASFSGTIASVIVGIVTYRLSEKIDEKNGADTELQKQMTVIKNMPNLICEDVELYSLNRENILKKHLLMFEKKSEYCLYIRMTPSFPAYFKICVLQMTIAFQQMGEKNGQHIKTVLMEEGVTYRFINHKNFKIYINVPEEIISEIEHLYLLNRELTNASSYQTRIVNLILRFKCDNELLPSNEGGIEFDMNLTLENKGKKADTNCIRIDVNNMQFVGVER